MKSSSNSSQTSTHLSHEPSPAKAVSTPPANQVLGERCEVPLKWSVIRRRVAIRLLDPHALDETVSARR